LRLGPANSRFANDTNGSGTLGDGAGKEVTEER